MNVAISSNSDKELILKYIEGDTSSFEKLIFKYKDRVYSYILMNVKNIDLANDIFQDTFIKVMTSLKVNKYQEKGNFISWIIRIAHNLIIDHYRKNKKLPTINNGQSDYDLFNNSDFSDLSIEQTIIKEQIKNDIKKLIDILPFEQKQVLLLRIYGDLSFKEIAELTSVSINTALGRMRYALINLRKYIEQNNISLTM